MASQTIFLLLALVSLPSHLASAMDDWDSFGPPPASPASNQKWELNPAFSDNFNYANKDGLLGKWSFQAIDGYLGPGATWFSPEGLDIVNNDLWLFGKPVPDSVPNNPVRCDNPDPASTQTTAGCTQESCCNCPPCLFTKRTAYMGRLESKEEIGFPIYTEVNMKASLTSMSSNFWLLDDLRETEIDVNENYGDDDYVRKAPQTNVHFFRQGGNFNDQKKTDTDRDLTTTFNRFGLHWKSSEVVEFFYNGEKVRTLDLPNSTIKDPSSLYLNNKMRIILDVEAHTWRKEGGIPMGGELGQTYDNSMVVQWIRTYNAVPV